MQSSLLACSLQARPLPRAPAERPEGVQVEDPRVGRRAAAHRQVAGPRPGARLRRGAPARVLRVRQAAVTPRLVGGRWEVPLARRARREPAEALQALGVQDRLQAPARGACRSLARRAVRTVYPTWEARAGQRSNRDGTCETAEAKPQGVSRAASRVAPIPGRLSDAGGQALGIRRRMPIWLLWRLFGRRFNLVPPTRHHVCRGTGDNSEGTNGR